VTSARFHDEARLEFLDSVAYYEAIQISLGERFRQSVEAAVELAASLPLAGSPHKHGTRRVFQTQAGLLEKS
jgi:plasmid stabilization system protein ParE